MRERPKILSLASALAALAAPVVTPPAADTASSDDAQIANKTDRKERRDKKVVLQAASELMSFTVHQTSDGILFPQHGSHVSHSSHSSHVSGGAPGAPYVPDVPYVPGTPYVPGAPGVPYVPYPPYGPTTTPPSTTKSSPAPMNPSDVARLACARASSGFGVNQIATELERLYGLSEQEAVSIANQALAAVHGGGHYCDGYPH
ncbi:MULTISPECIES: His-Xaa-Ser repeat protein HxsA2 [unclassified Mycobacterium]|uniref:His-Xaa-Ser repeat protein HxsA2 n=1 Tax=unclassified Mycobacterium TaxID=2642494 RepID=UPI0037C6FE6C